jgi:hypothetical protein
MNLAKPESCSDEKLSAIARELRIIRNILGFFLLLLISAMSSVIDRDFPLIVFPAGLFAAIAWSVIDAVARRSRRAKGEAEVFRRRSARIAKAARLAEQFAAGNRP